MKTTSVSSQWTRMRLRLTLCSSVVQITSTSSKKCSSNSLKGNTTSSLTLAKRTTRWSTDSKKLLRRLMTGKTDLFSIMMKSTLRPKISKSGPETKSTSTLGLTSGSSAFSDLISTTWTISNRQTDRKYGSRKTCRSQSWLCHKNLFSFTLLTTLTCALALAKASTWMRLTKNNLTRSPNDSCRPWMSTQAWKEMRFASSSAHSDLPLTSTELKLKKLLTETSFITVKQK